MCTGNPRPAPSAHADAGGPPLRRPRTTQEALVLTVVLLVAFFALLTLADVLPGQSGAPGLVAPLH
jgi:hypothetical protein